MESKELELGIKKLEDRISEEIMKFTSSYKVTPEIRVDVKELKTKSSGDIVFRIPEVKVKVLI